MTQDHSSKLSFSIEESVWLNKGQEVDEIVSLSLDPDITVEESGDYVLIRGGLKLTGEYRSNLNSNPIEETMSLSDQVGFRSIEEVTVNEDGTGEIRHHFPIDVTIPQERINSLDDIYVIVESFDYDLPERGCIQLTADVAITGMTMGKVEAKTPSASQQTSEPVEQEDRSFHYEAYSGTESRFDESTESDKQKVVERAWQDRTEESDVLEDLGHSEVRDEPVGLGQSEEESETVHLNQSEERDEPVSLGQSEERDGPVGPDQTKGQYEPTSAIPSEVSNEQARAEYQQDNLKNDTEEEVELEKMENIEVVTEVPEVKTPSVAFGVIKDRPKQEAATKDETEQPKQNQDQPYGMLKSLAENRLEEKQQQAKHETQQEQNVYQGASQQGEYNLNNDGRAEVGVVNLPLQEEGIEVETVKEENENALYLTKMLTKGEEEFKKLKMCIIQEDETLEIIASRYKINQNALIKVNRLNESTVEAGQILYIPARQ